MTERGADKLHQSPDGIGVGASSYQWFGDKLVIKIDEVTAFLPFRLTGEVILTPKQQFDDVHVLDNHGRHFWRPVAPIARVEANFSSPKVSFNGHGYFDMNSGTEPLEDGFIDWNWTRADHGDEATMLYCANRRDGTSLSLGLDYHLDGRVETFDPASPQKLPRAFWGIKGEARPDEGEEVKVLKRVEDSPFYARYILDMPLRGRPVHAMHETLNLNAFRNPVVKAMLPWRMPRGWWFDRKR